MEDVLDLYEAAYDPAYPVVCFDESPKQLIAEVREPIPVQPGAPAREDTEYVRKGVRDLMMICEPKRGWREVLITERRTKIDFAHCMKHVVGCYPEAAVIRVVLDNLNTHKPASLYEAFPPEEAQRLLSRLEIHYTPKHGSWLNMAETELGILSRQCLDRWIEDREKLTAEIAAWETDRNVMECKIHWHFTTHDARIKLQRLYPVIQPVK